MPTDGLEKQTPAVAEETRPHPAAVISGTSTPVSQPLKEGLPGSVSPPIPLKQRRRIFRVTYTNTSRREQKRPFKDRDGIAFNEIIAELTDSDYAYEGTIILYPNDKRPLDMGYPEFDSSDLLALTCRPPLNDEEIEEDQVAKDGKDDKDCTTKSSARKFIPRNNGPLEEEIFELCRKYFEHCSRKIIRLTEKAQALLSKDIDKKLWRHLEFFENLQTEGKLAPGERMANPRQFATIKAHHLSLTNSCPPISNRASTVGYLIRDRLPRIDCDVLVSFGMDGYCTLVWNRFVRKQRSDWIKKYGFVMAEFFLENLQTEIVERFRYPYDTPNTPITIASTDEIVHVKILAEAGPIA